MAGVCALAYAVGSIIRYNITNAEPVLASNPSEATLSFECASDFALVLEVEVSKSGNQTSRPFFFSERYL
jgi:hypothetical protein